MVQIMLWPDSSISNRLRLSSLRRDTSGNFLWSAAWGPNRLTKRKPPSQWRCNTAQTDGRFMKQLLEPPNLMIQRWTSMPRRMFWETSWSWPTFAATIKIEQIRSQKLLKFRNCVSKTRNRVSGSKTTDSRFKSYVKKLQIHVSETR